MGKRLPKMKSESISSRPQETVREYVQRRIDENKIVKEELEGIGGYLCEAEIYTPANYEKVSTEFKNYSEEYRSDWLVPIYQQNKKTFIEQFEKVITYTGDWVKARMLVHTTIQTMEMNGVDIFAWADDQMIDYMAKKKLARMLAAE